MLMEHPAAILRQEKGGHSGLNYVDNVAKWCYRPTGWGYSVLKRKKGFQVEKANQECHKGSAAQDIRLGDCDDETLETVYLKVSTAYF